MKYIIMAVLGLSLIACGKVESESTQQVGNNANVEKLFTVDGCTVYRFKDWGSTRYFTNCRGSTQWTETCGKNCSRDMTVDGGR